MKAINVSRVSTEEQKEAGNSLPAQIERIRKYCERKGFDVAERDILSFDESAYKEKRDDFDSKIIVIEAKGGNEQTDYETNKKAYKGKLENLTNEVLAKEIGFNEFQNVNKNFEYHIIFNASLQREQLRLLEELKRK